MNYAANAISRGLKTQLKRIGKFIHGKNAQKPGIPVPKFTWHR